MDESAPKKNLLVFAAIRCRMSAGIGWVFFAVRIAVAFLLLLYFAGAACAERRVALVIGADDYRTARRLENAVNDARAIEKALEKLSFEVFVETNRDLRRMRRALEDFRTDAAGADVALVFFAGHGVEIAGENRLLPVDADASSLEALEATSLRLEEITETVRAVAPVALVLLDACRNDPFSTQAASGSGRGAAPLTSVGLPETVRPGLGRVGKAENVLFAFATAPGKTASDGTEANSPFTTALARYLGTNGVQIGSALKLAQQDVYDRTRKSQLPYIEDGLPAMFFAAAKGELPERERLLLAMADLSSSMREEVERIAAAHDVPLAPLYAALIGSNLSSLSADARAKKLEEAAQAYAQTQDMLRTLATTDPEVTRLRAAAEHSLALGALADAEANLDLAIAVDRKARTSVLEVLVSRTVSEAASLAAKAGVAHTALDHAGAITALEQAAALHQEIEAFPLSGSARLARDIVLMRLGDIYGMTATTKEALDAYDRMRSAAKTWIAHAPNEPEALYDLAIASTRIGFVQFARGNLDATLTSFRESNTIIRHLAANVPVTAESQLDLAFSSRQIAEVQLAQGELAAAMENSRHVHAVIERLALSDPGNENLQWHLGNSLSGVGDVQMAQLDLTAALNSFRGSLAVLERLVAIDPGYPKWQLTLADSFAKLGEVLQAQGDLSAALESYRESHAIAERFASRDPTNVTWQGVLSMTVGRIGNVQLSLGQLEPALQSYRESHAVFERLAASDPDHSDWQFGLAVSLGGIAEVQLARGELGAALQSFRDTHAVVEAFAASVARNPRWERQLSISFHKIGDVQAAQGDLDAALKSHRDGKVIVERLAARNPRNPGWQGDLSVSLRRIGEVLVAQGDIVGGLKSYRESLAIADRLAAGYPDNAEWQRHLMVLHIKIAEAGQDKRKHLSSSLALALAMQANGTLPPKDAWMLDDIRVQLKTLGSTEK